MQRLKFGHHEQKESVHEDELTLQHSLAGAHAKIKSDGIVYKSYGLYIRKVGP